MVGKNPNQNSRSGHSTAFHEAMMTAFDEAADGVEQWEYGGAETQAEQMLHRNAAVEVAKRIRAMAKRYLLLSLVAVEQSFVPSIAE